jgi:hypothetical protein
MRVGVRRPAFSLTFNRLDDQRFYEALPLTTSVQTPGCGISNPEQGLVMTLSVIPVNGWSNVVQVLTVLSDRALVKFKNQFIDGVIGDFLAKSGYQKISCRGWRQSLHNENKNLWIH